MKSEGRLKGSKIAVGTGGCSGDQIGERVWVELKAYFGDREQHVCC